VLSVLGSAGNPAVKRPPEKYWIPLFAHTQGAAQKSFWEKFFLDQKFWFLVSAPKISDKQRTGCGNGQTVTDQWFSGDQSLNLDRRISGAAYDWLWLCVMTRTRTLAAAPIEQCGNWPALLSV